MEYLSFQDLRYLGHTAKSFRDLPANLEEMYGNEKVTEDLYDDANPSYWPAYSFLYLLAQRMQPRVFVESGLELGRATAAVATGCPGCQCVGIEINGKIANHWVRWLSPLPNVSIALCDSIDWAFTHRDVQIDLLHIDSSHLFLDTAAEWHMFRRLITPGGIVVFDDINTEGVNAVWTRITDPKDELPDLHGGMGTGVVVMPV